MHVILRLRKSERVRERGERGEGGGEKRKRERKANSAAT